MATDVASPLPAVELLPLSTLTVTVDQAGAKITLMNVHGVVEDAAVAPPVDDTAPSPLLVPIFDQAA